MKVGQSCPTLCDPMNYTVHVILQARILECVPSPGYLPSPGIEHRSPTLQVDSLPAEPQEKPKNTGVGSIIHSPVDLPKPKVKPGSSALQVDSLPTGLWRKPTGGSELTSMMQILHAHGNNEMELTFQYTWAWNESVFFHCYTYLTTSKYCSFCPPNSELCWVWGFSIKRRNVSQKAPKHVTVILEVEITSHYFMLIGPVKESKWKKKKERGATMLVGIKILN